jgi:hypothetical protein
MVVLPATQRGAPREADRGSPLGGGTPPFSISR